MRFLRGLANRQAAVRRLRNKVSVRRDIDPTSYLEAANAITDAKSKPDECAALMDFKRQVCTFKDAVITFDGDKSHEQEIDFLKQALIEKCPHEDLNDWMMAVGGQSVFSLLLNMVNGGITTCADLAYDDRIVFTPEKLTNPCEGKKIQWRYDKDNGCWLALVTTTFSGLAIDGDRDRYVVYHHGAWTTCNTETTKSAIAYDALYTVAATFALSIDAAGRRQLTMLDDSLDVINHAKGCVRVNKKAIVQVAKPSDGSVTSAVDDLTSRMHDNYTPEEKTVTILDKPSPVAFVGLFSKYSKANHVASGPSDVHRAGAGASTTTTLATGA